MTRRLGDAETRGNDLRPRVSVSSPLRVFLLVLTLAAAAFALEIPPAPTQWVTDRAAILAAADLQALNSKLRSFEERSGVQFIIYVLPSLEGDSLERFSIKAAEKWKVGQAKYDNGLILFVFPQDRKTRIEVGYGLEGTITDAFASDVIREVLAPQFRRGDYAGGLNAAADRIIARIEKTEVPVPTERRSPGSGLDISDVFTWLVVIFVIMMVLRGRGGCLFPFFLPGVTFGGGGGGWRGGGGGFGGGFGGFSGGGGGFGGGGASGSW